MAPKCKAGYVPHRSFLNLPRIDLTFSAAEKTKYAQDYRGPNNMRIKIGKLNATTDRQPVFLRAEAMNIHWDKQDLDNSDVQLILRVTRYRILEVGYWPAPPGQCNKKIEYSPSVFTTKGRPPPFTVETEEDVESHPLALMPYGQTGTLLADITEVAALKAKWTFNVPSFEVWCAMTNYAYDAGADNASNGGDKFQRMLHFLLVSRNNTQKPVQYVPHDKNLSDERSVQATPGEPSYLSETTRIWEGADRGGEIGFNSQGQGAAGAAGFTSLEANANLNIEAPVTIRPGSKGNWMRAFGLHHEPTGKHTVRETEYSKGYANQPNVPQESKGDMAIANNFAALIGLYYYPGCNDAAKNWTVAQEIDGRLYQIRMRQPNPRYKRSDTRLFVREKLAAAARKDTHKGKFMGDFNDNGDHFVVPHLLNPRKMPPTVWELFTHVYIPKNQTHRATVTTIAPFLGTASSNFLSSTKAKIDKARCSSLHTQFGASVHEPQQSEGFFLGFRMSQALWLYPHYYKESELIEDTGTGYPIGYQPDPQPNPAYYKKGKWTDHKLTSIRDAFKAPPFGYNTTELSVDSTTEHKDARRRWVLGLPSKSGDNTGPTDAEEKEATDVNPDGNQEDTDDVAPNIGGAADLKRTSVLFAVQDTDDALLESGEDKNTFKREAIRPGSASRKGELVTHYSNSDAHPWPHKDLYKPCQVDLKAEVATPEKVKEYIEKYGSDSNLYVRAEGGQPTLINSIEHKFGEAKQDILDSLITSDSALHRKHLLRILCIYFDDSAMTPDLTVTDKQKGMRGGVYGRLTSHKVAVSYGSSSSSDTLLWGKVFDNDPNKVFTAAQKRAFKLKENRSSDKTLQLAAQGFDLSKLKSSMTVAEWITTPWHYAFLPYQPQHSLFKDGETYSEGCLRCSRQFYEFEELYAPYKHTARNGSGWPTLYWKHSDNTPSTDAPRPFHDPDFWDETPTAPIVGGDQTEQLLEDDIVSGAYVAHDVADATYQGWQTFEFKMSKFDQAKRKLNQNQLRVYTYRKFFNHVFRDREYPKITQGRFGTGNSKVLYGTTNYMLTRSSRYGNICRDCAQLLETAPGLYVRNYRLSTPLGNQDNVRASDAWWPRMIHFATLVSDGDLNFNPAFLHAPKGKLRLNEAEREEYAKQWDLGMKWFVAWLKQNQDVHNVTKVVSSPDVYVQKVVKLSTRAREKNKKKLKEAADEMAEEEPKRIGEAIQTLKRLMIGCKANKGVNISKEAMQNPALFDIVTDVVRLWEHKTLYTQAKQTKTFDSNMVRYEYRSVERTRDGKSYKNCLEIKQWHPSKESVKKTGAMTSVMAAAGGDYLTTVYYCDLKVENGVDVEENGGSQVFDNDNNVLVGYDETQWVGDKLVTQPDGQLNTSLSQQEREHLVVQKRRMKQSRLFITYSLHRPVTDEAEARCVMEKMADAVRMLFGSDKLLSQLLVIGYKLKQEGTADQISNAQFVPITRPRKDNADWYGLGEQTSYMSDTYETHVEKVEVDAGIEIGPIMHHPHFHTLLTVTHWTYIQIDYFAMNSYLEAMFRGNDPHNMGWGRQFKLDDASGGNFYTDNEHPYVNIKLYPQDDWQDVIAAYVRKNATPGPIEAIRIREGI